MIFRSKSDDYKAPCRTVHYESSRCFPTNHSGMLQEEGELPVIPARGRPSLVSRGAASALTPPGAASGPSAAPSSAPGARVPTPQAPTLSGFRLTKQRVDYVAVDQ